jgi:hypothetical protein
VKVVAVYSAIFGCLLLRLLSGCGGDAFGLGPIPDAGAGDAPSELIPNLPAADGDVPQTKPKGRGVDGGELFPDAPGDPQDAHPVMTTPDAAALEPEGAPPREAGPPPVCNPGACLGCEPTTTGYGCCTAAGVCGCENPSQGGSCR